MLTPWTARRTRPRQPYHRRTTDRACGNVHHWDVARAGRAGQTDALRTTDLDIGRLSLAERIQLAEDLWDSVAAETGGLPLTEAQAAELDHRLAQLAHNPDAGDSWEVVRGRIQERLDKAG